jgi:cyclohexanecarboxylate-CoA ligase/acyl-CoA synthetase
MSTTSSAAPTSAEQVTSAAQSTSTEQEPVGGVTVEGRYGRGAPERFRAEGWWLDGCATDLLDRYAVERPDSLFVTDGTLDLNYASVRGRAYRLAARLLESGVRRGDRVAVQLPNWSEFVVSYLALARIGAVMVPIMMVYRTTEVRHVLHNSDAVAAITTRDFRGFDHAEMFRTLRADCPSLSNLVVVRSGAAEGEIDFEAACEPLRGAEAPDEASLGPRPEPDAPHIIVYTSGTESTAKGCVHTWNTVQYSGRGLAEQVFRMTADDVMFMPSPVSHATGFVVGVLVPLNAGAQTHLLDVWEAGEGLRRIEHYRCTTTAAATPFVRMALDASPGAGRDVSSMRLWLCAGAPIPEALAREFADVFGGGRLVPLYGCSEVMAATCCHLEDSLERASNSDGSPALDGITIMIADLEGKPLPTGEEGEICYRGPGAVLGYWREPERTAATIDPQGWHHTGDLGRLDAEGYLRVTGRLKDIIIRGGTNISAGEVEGHLLAHPDIREVALVGYPDDRLGERACAVVVPADSAKPTLDEVIAFLRAERGIAVHKLPEKLVLVDSLPMTGSGKVQKFKLRDLARDA